MRRYDKRKQHKAAGRSRLSQATYAACMSERLEDRTLLATFLVTKTADNGPGSLRQAILDANAAPGADVIQFGGSKFTDATPDTITPASGLPDLQDQLQIQGPGAKLLTVNTTFQVPSGVQVGISGMSGVGGSNFGTLTVTECDASGFYNAFTGRLTLIRSAITSGGSIRNDRDPTSTTPEGNGHVTLINSTISHQQGNSRGAVVNGGVLTLINSTITASRFAGVWFDGGMNQVNLRNSIVAGNGVGTGTPDIDNDGLPFFPWQFFATTSLVGVNPLLGPLQDNGGPTLSHAPLPGSPAINAGTNALGASEPTDQRGYTRIRGGRIDIGAVETTGASLVVTTTADENNGTSDATVGSGTSLREAIVYAAAHAGPDTITFGLPDGPQTIQLTSVLPDLTDDLKITGPLSSRVTVAGAGSAGGFRVFTVASAQTVAITNVGVSNGFADASGGGAGILNAGGALTLTGVTVSNNRTAGVGGGILTFGTLTLTNSTVSGNFAALDGGGVAGNDNVVIRNSTITDNVADSDANGSGAGGGLFVGGFTPAVVDNSIVADNRRSGGTRSDLVGSASGHFNLVGVNTGFIGITNGVNGNQVGTAVSPINPKLNNLADNGGPTLTHLPKSSSPVLNAGSAAYLAAGTLNDQRGFGYLRASGAAVDIGAVEVQTQIASLVVTTEADENDGASNPALGSGTSLSEAILYANAHPGHDAITIAPGVNDIVLSSELPELTTDLDITGVPNGLGLYGKVILRRSPTPPPLPLPAEFRILRVAPNADVHLSGFVTTDGAAVEEDALDGNGGNIHNRGTLTLTDMVVDGGGAAAGAGRGGGIYNAGTLTVVDSFVTLGGGELGGGCIYNDNFCTLTDSLVSNGNAGAGGGIFNSGRLIASGSSIQGSADSGRGGGGLFNTGFATITDCTLSGSAGSGGGLFNAGFATITGSTLSGSASDSSGGGVANAGSLSLSDSTVSFGSALVGGGISNSGTMLMTRCTVDSNAAGIDSDGLNGAGGGIANFGKLTVTDSTISNNASAGSGGGIQNGGMLTMANSTISGNSAFGDSDYVGGHGGGGISNGDDFDSGTITLLNCTVADNDVVSGSGGGIANVFGTLTIRNTLIATNTAGGSDDVFGGITAGSNNNLIGDGTGMTGITDGDNGNQVGTDAAPIDPMLGPLADNGGPTQTHALLTGSPAIDAGNNASIPPDTSDADGDGNTTEPAPFDQTGLPRIVATTVDIGAWELHSPPAPPAAAPLVAAQFSLVPVGQGHAFDPKDLPAQILDLPGDEFV